MGRQTSKPRQNRRAARAINSATIQLLEPRLLFAVQTFDVTNPIYAGGAHIADDGHDDTPAIKAAMAAATADGTPGDVIYFPAGTYNLLSFSSSNPNQGLVLNPNLVYLGVFDPTAVHNPSDPSGVIRNDLSILKGADNYGPQVHITGDNVTLEQLRFEYGGIMIDKGSQFNNNIHIDNCEINFGAPGADNNGITATSGLQNSTLTNNLFTSSYGGNGFGILSFNYNGLTVANNNFVNIKAGWHNEAWSGSGNLTVEQNYLTGIRGGMGFELENSSVPGVSNILIQDNYYENPNQGTLTHSQLTNFMAFSLVFPTGNNIEVRRNYINAPQRPDGIGVRIGIETAGVNYTCEDNYVVGCEYWATSASGVTPTSVTIKNNQVSGAVNGTTVRIDHPAPGRVTTLSNNNGNVQLTWDINRGPAGRNNRYGQSPPGSPPPPPPPPPPLAPIAPTALAGTVVGTSQINFTWQETWQDTGNSDGKESFAFQMLADDGVTWVTIATINGSTGTLPATSYTLTGVASGTTYQFRVLADNSAGYSDPSTPTTVTMPLADVMAAGTSITTASKRTKPSLISAGTAAAPTQTATS